MRNVCLVLTLKNSMKILYLEKMSESSLPPSAFRQALSRDLGLIVCHFRGTRAKFTSDTVVYSRANSFTFLETKPYELTLYLELLFHTPLSNNAT